MLSWPQGGDDDRAERFLDAAAAAAPASVQPLLASVAARIKKPAPMGSDASDSVGQAE